MLSSFTIQNFRSVLDLKLDFSYGEGKAPNGYQEQEIMPFIDAPGKQRLLPCMAFFGANASGKTNILKAFSALKRLIREGGPLASAYEPNLLNPKFTHTTFSLEYRLGEDLFLYGIAYNATEIVEERFLKNGKPVYAIKNLHPEFSPKILSDTYSKQKLTDILRVECSDGETQQTKTFLNRIGMDYRGLDVDLKNAFMFFLTQLSLYTNERPLFLPSAVKTLAADFGGDQEAALREISDVVRRLDIDIHTIAIHHTELKANEKPGRGVSLLYDHEKGSRIALNVTTTHTDVDGKAVLFDFMKHESAGTQRLAGLVGIILHTLKTGGVLLVDELECSLHPLLMREIVLLFKKRSHNPKGAQLIFTTHNTDILDDSILRVSEIAMVRKTTANGTMVRRLVDAKKDGDDIRNVTNFRKQYLAGFYSGVPHPAL